MNKKLVVAIIGSACLIAFVCGSIVSSNISAQSSSLYSSTPTSLTPFSFTKNLSLGNSDQDVKQLQIFLNTDPATMVAVNGTGSVGHEGTYFGPMTQQAVMRLQQKYQKEVLTPYGLTYPTGFVGAATRKKINDLILAKIINSNANVSSYASSKSFNDTRPLRLYLARPQQVRRSDSFVLVGSGFEDKNTLHVGPLTFKDVPAQDNSNISFTLPVNSAVPNGSYKISVENTKGNSQTNGKDVLLVFTDNPIAPPVILSAVPATVSLDGTVTVTGSGFAATGNSIVSGFGTLDNVTSNGTQINFIPRSLISDKVIEEAIGQTIKFDFYIINNIGPSNIKGSVMVKL